MKIRKLITATAVVVTTAVGVVTVGDPAGASTRNPCQDLLNAIKSDVAAGVYAWSVGNDEVLLFNNLAGAERAYDQAAFLFFRANNATETYQAECG